MLDLLREIFGPGFLLKHALWATLLLGVTAPLAGGFLLLRRSIFLGVALPQVSAAGLSGGLLFSTFCHFDSDGAHTGGVVALGGALCATGAVLLLLAWLSRKSGDNTDAHHGVCYALAGAGTVLLLAFHPHAGHGLAGLLRGEIVSIGPESFHLSALILLPATALLLFFRYEFLQTGYDPDFSAAAGHRVWCWDAALLGIIGVIIGVAVFLAGPLTCFGAMLLPALAAHRLARRMIWFFPLAMLIGVVGALIGFVAAYHWDLPTGATLVAVNGMLLGLTSLARK